MRETVDYGPLSVLIGTWQGDKGIDIAPKPEEDENNPYYETLTFEPVDIDIENAEKQQLAAIRYHQLVREKSNDKVSHDETGYWIFNKVDNTILLTFSIPRGVSVLAVGEIKRSNDDPKDIVLNVSAKLNNSDSGIVQSSFMFKNAKTTSFSREMRISGDKLSYTQETIVDIYDKKSFSHTDENILIKM